MTYDPNLHHRRSIRLAGYDYRKAGAYFITIDTHDRCRLFGTISKGIMTPSAYGTIVAEHWHDLPNHHPNVGLDEFVVMPDHVHGIIVLDGTALSYLNAIHGAMRASPLRPSGAASGSLGAILGSFKSAVTRRINAVRGTPRATVWHRNYHERIIRDESALEHIRTYIRNNPANWKGDLILTP